MLVKGTKSRSGYDISQSMESVGGYLNASTSTDYTCYYSRCLDTELDRAMEVLSDMVRNAIFPEEEVEKEKKVVLEEMKMYRDSSDDVIFEEFSGRIFRSSPLGRPDLGIENTVSSFTRENLFDYMEERYRPDNLLVAVAGNVNHEDVVELAEAWLNHEVSHKTENEEQPLPPYKQFRSEDRKS